MLRLASFLIAAVLVAGIGGVQFAQSQTEPPAAQTAPKAKKALTPEEKAELAAKRKAMTPEEKAKRKEQIAAKKEAAAAKKAKRQECVAQGKQDNLKGAKLREFLKTCTGG